MKLVCRIGEDTTPVEVVSEGAGYRVKVGEKTFLVDMITVNRVLHSLHFDDTRQYLVGHHADGSRHEISFADRTVHVDVFDPLALKRRRRDDEGDSDASHVKAAMPGRVTKILVGVGDEVRRGKGLLILEAMKMENEIVSPRDGIIKELKVTAGQAVESGDEMIVLE